MDLEQTPSGQSAETAMDDWRKAIFHTPSASFTYKMGERQARDIGFVHALYVMLFALACFACYVFSGWRIFILHV